MNADEIYNKLTQIISDLVTINDKEKVLRDLTHLAKYFDEKHYHYNNMRNGKLFQVIMRLKFIVETKLDSLDDIRTINYYKGAISDLKELYKFTTVLIDTSDKDALEIIFKDVKELKDMTPVALKQLYDDLVKFRGIQ